MAQYKVFQLNEYETYTDGVSTFRVGNRNGVWVEDITLTPLGFAGSFLTDWTYMVYIGSVGTTIYRQGVTSLKFVVDQSIDGGSNWTNLITYPET